MRKKEKTRIRFGFREKNQMPLFMIWKEYYNSNNEVYFAKVLFEIQGRKCRREMEKKL